MTVFLLVVNILALLSFMAAAIHLHAAHAERTVGGRAAQALLLACFLLAVVGILRRMDVPWWPNAQAVAWLLAGSTAIGVLLTTPGDHDVPD